MKKWGSAAFFALLAPLSALAWVAIAGWTVLVSSLMAGLFLVHPWLDPRRRLLHRLAQLWGRGLMRFAPGGQVQLFGWERIPRDQPVIFLANHQSYVDVPTLFHLPGQYRWMADEGLFRIPVFGWAMRMIGTIPVLRGDARSGRRGLQQARDWLEQGISIFIFPEGTRSRTGLLGRFQSGAFRLAAEAQVPLVPVILSGTRQLLPRGGWVFRWGARVRIGILEPVPAPSGSRSIRPLIRQVRARMRSAYAEQLKTGTISPGDRFTDSDS